MIQFAEFLNLLNRLVNKMPAANLATCTSKNCTKTTEIGGIVKKGESGVLPILVSAKNNIFIKTRVYNDKLAIAIVEKPKGMGFRTRDRLPSSDG